MVALTELGDASHPKFALTQRNASTDLLKVPLEVRLLIYEHAVKVEGYINPVQAADRSNKFFATRTQEGGKKHKRLAASSLATTGRQIYHELEGYPVLYRVNNFLFARDGDLVKFLVAITPKRREMIRTVGIVLPTVGMFRSVPKFNQDTRTMLDQCKDLRHVQLRIDIGDWCSYNATQEQVSKVVLEACLHRATDSTTEDMQSYHPFRYLTRPITENFTWDVPFLRPILEASKTDFSRDPSAVDFSIDLADLESVKSAPADSWIHKKPIKDLVMQVFTAITTRRERLQQQEEAGKGPRALITNADLADLYRRAEIDFPGEDRVSQDRFNSVCGTISSRTRGRCKTGDAINGLGVMKKDEKSKYDEEGFVTERFHVYGFRWNGSTIEGEIALYTAPGDTTWEPIHALSSITGRFSIIEFFSSLKREHSWKDPIERLEEIKSMPSPNDVAGVIEELFGDPVDVAAPVLRRLKRQWNGAKKAFDTFTQGLNGAAEEARKKAAEAEKKTKKRAKKRENGEKAKAIKRGRSVGKKQTASRGSGRK